MHTYERELLSTGHVIGRRGPSVDNKPEFSRRYLSPSLKDVDIGYAGRQPQGHLIHERIARLSHGSPLKLQKDAQFWLLVNAEGRPVGKMSKSFQPPAGMTGVEARVRAILTRTIDMTDDGFKQYLQVPTWEVVVPELVFQ